MSLGNSYVRAEVDCRKLRWRNIREGEFKSETQVSFRNEDENWQKPMSDYQKDMSTYICNTKNFSQ